MRLWWGLPKDNFPDDTESRAFQNFRELNPQPTLPRKPVVKSRRWVWGIAGLFLLLGLGGVGLFVAIGLNNNTEGDPSPQPRPTLVRLPSNTMGGDFPPLAEQLIIKVPGRVSNVLMPSALHGYTFIAHEAFLNKTITVVVFGTTNSANANAGVPTLVTTDLNMLISIYQPDGTLLTQIVGNTISFPITVLGQYGVLVQSTDAAAWGSYTISLYPER